MRNIKTCALLLAMVSCGTIRAQVINFEESPALQVEVWDAWENSPFRTGKLMGNCQVVDNPYRDDTNPSAKVLGCQRSLYGSNMYGAKVALPREMQFELTPQEQYLHVQIHKPLAGRCMLLVLGKHTGQAWAHQSEEVVQSTRLAMNDAFPGEWTDVVFPMKGAGDIRAHSIVVVFDCESPHRLKEPFLVYMDNIRLGEAAPQKTAVGTANAGQHDGRVLVTNSQRNGEVLLADGKPFNAGYYHPSGTPLKVKGVGEQGFVCTAIIVHHGPGRTLSTTFGKSDFQPDGTLIIPADLLTGDILIEGVMTEQK